MYWISEIDQAKRIIRQQFSLVKYKRNWHFKFRFPQPFSTNTIIICLIQIHVPLTPFNFLLTSQCTFLHKNGIQMCKIPMKTIMNLKSTHRLVTRFGTTPEWLTNWLNECGVWTVHTTLTLPIILLTRDREQYGGITQQWTKRRYKGREWWRTGPWRHCCLVRRQHR